MKHGRGPGNNLSDELLYFGLAERIKSRILSGEYGPGTALPSMRELNRLHGVSLTTIGRAFEILRTQGLVEKGASSRQGYRVASQIPATAPTKGECAELTPTQPGFGPASTQPPARSRRTGVSDTSEPGRQRVTIREVATKAGVSCTTVSYVVNGKSGGGIRISEETRRRVRQAIAELKYRPSQAARTLRTNRSNLIALMVPFVDTPFGSATAASIQKAAARLGLNLAVFSSYDDIDREKELVEGLAEQGVEGLVAQTNQLLKEDLSQLVDRGISTVILGNAPMHDTSDNVMIDEYQASWDVTEELVRLGHRRIALVTGSEGTWYGKLRRKGYLHALKHYGIEPDRRFMGEADSNDPEDGGRWVETFLGLKERPTAAFVANDYIAAHALLYAVDRGIRVPEDLSIVGFDNLPISTLVRPRLSTVDKQVPAMCEMAVDLLFDRLEHNRNGPSRHRFLDYSIIRRESVKALT